MDGQNNVDLYPFGNTGLLLPKVMFGSGDLGNLYRVMPFEQKRAIIGTCIDLSSPVTVFDTAGKYGAGLALEVIGQSLYDLGVPQDRVVISNKIGWARIPLKGKEPTFEPGIWKDLSYDAEQRISYQGMLDCFEEGNRLLKYYTPQLLSVHDPDEYLDVEPERRKERFENIMEAYRALGDLKKQGVIKAVGVGAKDWTVIRELYDHVKLDWVMIANSLSLHHHPLELLDFISQLHQDGVAVINAAVFNGGFLVGGHRYNYRSINVDNPEDQQKVAWRNDFFDVCRSFGVTPAHACIQFALSVPGVHGVALSPADVEKVKENFEATRNKLPTQFWQAMKDRNLLVDFKFV